jgi:outer membrane protein, heavy metal efflux system
MARPRLRALCAGLTVSTAVGCAALPSSLGGVAGSATPTTAPAASPLFAELASAQAPVAPAPLATPPATPVGTADRLDLDRLEQLAQTHNPILQRDLARVEAARGQVIQAGLYPNPRFEPPNPQVLNGRSTLLNVGIQQEIVTKGKLSLDTAAADEAVRQAELNFQQSRLELLGNVRRQYYTTLNARRRVEVLTELSGIVRAAAETGRKLEKAQESSRIDTLLLTVDAQKVEANLRQAKINLTTERKQLAAVVGVPGVETAEIVGDLTARRPDFDEELVRRYAMTGSTLVRVAQAEITRRRLLLRRAEVEPYPNVTVGPAYQFGAQPRSDQFLFSVSFPIPVWDRNQGNILAAAANVRDAETSLRVLQNDQLSRVADTLGRYLAARQLVERYEQDILPNVQQAQKLSQEGYAKGVFDFARYLQAQRTVVETNLSYLDALDSLWSAATDVGKLLQVERLP